MLCRRLRRQKRRKKMKPIIGIVTKPLSEFECPDDIWTEDYVKDEFRDEICKGGCIPIGILPPFKSVKYNKKETENELHYNFTDDEKLDFDTVLEKCNGFVLQGGLCTDYYELYVAEYALHNNIPIVGICAGFNILARAAGAEVRSAKELGIDEKIHNVYSKDFRHPINIVRGTTLYKIFNTETLEVNSLHTYFLDNNFLNKHKTRIKVNATYSNLIENDNRECKTVEAFTIENTKFAMGIKWHPEIMEEEHKRKIFDFFLNECKNFRNIEK
jgi:putative glutamine amidotransferase